MSESSELDPYMAVKAKLYELGIKFQLVEHPPATTTELADKYIKGIDGARTKTMFSNQSQEDHLLYANHG